MQFNDPSFIFLYVIRFKNYSLVFIGIVSSSFIIRIFFHQLLCQIVMEKEIRISNQIKKKEKKKKDGDRKRIRTHHFLYKKPEFMPSSCFLLVFQ